MSRRLLAALTSGALLLPMTIAVASSATAAPADGPDIPPVSGAGGVSESASTEDKISPALAEADGNVTVFVELDATSGVDTAEAGGSGAAVEAAADTVEDLAADVAKEAAQGADVDPTTVAVTTDLVPGVVLQGDAQALRSLADSTAVKSITVMTPKKPLNAGTDAFTQALAAWQSTGFTGQDVTIGVIDTGLDYTHADFGGPGTVAAYEAAYGTDGTDPIPADSFDSTKFLGGWDFAGPTYDPGSDDPADWTPQPDANPIDPVDGHGSHVAGTAAGYGVLSDNSTFDGDYNTLTDLSDFKIGPGSAPEAGIYSLKVFGDVQGSTNLTLSAMEWAADPNNDGDYSDHLDIINMSLGADYVNADDPENLFIDQLTELGVLSVIASGNAGDVIDVGGTPGNAASALTVANSVGTSFVYDAVEVTAADDTALVDQWAAQNTINYTGDDVTAPVVFVGDDVDGCTDLSEYSAEIADKIVWLYWDDNDATRACGSTTRWDNAAEAGAAGAIVGWSDPVFTYGLSGSTQVPGAMLTAQATTALMPEIEAGTLTMRIGPGLANTATETNADAGDLVNSSSSRGVHGSLGIIKPDVAAPGTSISSVYSGTGSDATTKSGTSMATPHVAGIAALVAQAHPDWTAQQIKTAVMNTANHDLFTEPGQSGDIYAPERVGSGRVDAQAATTDEVIAYATDNPALASVTFGIVPVGTETVTKSATVTVENLGTSTKTYTTSFAQATGAGAATITTSPSTITVPAGGSTEVTVTLTADPATLARELDPTSAASYDLGADVPREYVTTISGRLVLSGGYSAGDLRLPVQAAPKLVSDMSTDPVVFDGDPTAPLSLTGSSVNSGGWISIVSPFVLGAESPALGDDAPAGVAPSAIGSADVRYVGYASTAPQYAAAGEDPADGTLSIGIATEGNWTSLGSTVYPVIDYDTDGDGVPNFETIVWKYTADTDFTTAETYEVVDTGSGPSLGSMVDLFPVNGLWASLETSVFDSNVLVAPVSLATLGITPGDEVSVSVEMWSALYDGGPIDTVDAFTIDPYAPDFWFDDGSVGSQWFYDSSDAGTVVHREADSNGSLLLLHAMNADGARAEIVPVTAASTETTTGLEVSGTLAEGSEQTLTATVDPAESTGTVVFTDGGTELGSAPVNSGVAELTVSLAAGEHSLVAAFTPDTSAFTGSQSEPVTVEIAARANSSMRVAMPHKVTDQMSAPILVILRSTSEPTGTIEVIEDGTVLTDTTVHTFGNSGLAWVQVPPLMAGTHHLTIAYSGNDQVAPTSTDRNLRVIATSYGHHRWN